ncbi:hypothetical protein [Mycolicibacterium diernhoferi]|uniref:DUF732 domain-containing protein n=1 Tax=Mycolicibacterium diernhoferi TaxID=1801 RepID=A0A1Q4H8V8_9MYCO|nr:hypothetical protein [Mycolicibacterium diernhoferi]OJZ63978.1 hypothetical protein BRW64_19800 [Mycolicibacterium diernhoferi]OPE54133.1 hypothetical protein BV510_11860 [Mycolicibacterium diernhoferi]PEG55638.1 hypothetical protein CRI78_05090 [Mycolicibacterium diernhoferi]QYL20666.1 hypothetical protein K0O62_16420 [Mycolicibacterium diernhoferi]
MNKVLALGLGTSAAAVAMMIAAGGTAHSAPASESDSPYNVVGQTYGRAVQILAGSGIKATFGGAVGSDLQQSLCVVDKQKFNTSGRMILMLNCTQEAFDEAGLSNSTGSGPGGRTVGANGVTTVTPTPMPPPGAGVPTSPAPVPPPA